MHRCITEGVSMNTRKDKQPDQQRDQQGGSSQEGGTRRGADPDERFGPGSSPQERENDASGNTPSREDMSRRG
jgi:hypothetical protein